MTVANSKGLPVGATPGFTVGDQARCPDFGAFRKHGKVLHVIHQYAKADGTSTNTIEGYFSIFKRGMRGIYQHWSEKHLHRYLAEFDFRYSNRAKLGVDDELRTERVVCGIIGKRLTYRTTNQQA